MAEITKECWDRYLECMLRVSGQYNTCMDDCWARYSNPPSPEGMVICTGACKAIAQAGEDLCGLELDKCAGRPPRERQRYEERQKRYFNAGGTAIFALGGVTATVGVGMMFAPSPAWYPVAGLGLTAIGIGAIIYATYQIGKTIDPVDSNFKALARPRPPLPFVIRARSGTPIDTGVASAMNAVLENQANVIGLDRALMTSIERAQGAAVEKERAYEKRQMENARKYAGELAVVARQSAGLRSRAAAELRENGAVFSVSHDEADRTRKRLLKNKLPTKVQEVLTRYCDDADETKEIRLRWLSQLADVHRFEVTFPDVLAVPRLAAAEKKIASALEEFSKSKYLHL